MTDRPAIGIVGLGTMGLGIAQVYAQAGFPVIATDAHAPARDSAHSRMAETLNARITAGKLTEPDRDATLSRLTMRAGDLTALGPCQLIIEAVSKGSRPSRSSLPRWSRSSPPRRSLRPTPPRCQSMPSRRGWCTPAASSRSTSSTRPRR